MTNGNPNNFEEIALAIALLGGIIAVLLYIREYFNNNVIPTDADLQGIVYTFVVILLLEIPIIVLFFLFKGISIYAKPDWFERILKKFTQTLFKFSFVYFLLWLISIIFTFIFVNIIYQNNISLSNHPYIFPIYNSVLLILLVIVGLILMDYNVFEFIIQYRRYSLGEYWKINRIFFLRFIGIIVLVLLLFYLFSPFVGLLYSLSYYMLMGSYSIEEILQPNNDNITIGIKETGLILNSSYISLSKMDTDLAQGDFIKITANQVNFSEKGFMVGNNRQFGIWYLSVINTSKLQPGNYLLHAEVTIYKSPTLGTLKKQTDKLFYIAPSNSKYSFNSTLQ